MTVKHCARCRRTFYAKVESPTIALGWVCIDCNKDRERKDVLSLAKCRRCDLVDNDVVEAAGNNVKLRCKNCGNIWTESWGPSMTKEDKPTPKEWMMLLWR